MRKIYLLYIFFQTFSIAKCQEIGLENIYSLYRATISDIRPTNCPMYPSCSKYSEYAFKKYGFFKGMTFTTDRLMRCGHELNLYPSNEINNEIKFLDFSLIDMEDTLNIDKKEKQYLLRNYNEKNPNDIAFFFHLVDNGFYNEAIIEYKRKIFFEPSFKSHTFEINYIRSLFALSKYEDVIFSIKNSSFYDDNIFRIKLSEAYFKLENYNMALNSLENLNNYKALELRGLINIKLGNLDSAVDNYSQINSDYIFYDYIEQNQKTISDLKKINYKSKNIAGFLGVIPGGGYLYSGQKATALTSLLLNSVFCYATITSIKSKNYGVAGLTGLFGTAFYIGNIFGGIKSVERYNTYKKNYYLEKMKYSFNN
jgi:putative component of membrane protein insertase Oxa1/YidC/SpoIIIJ protein YidD